MEDTKVSQILKKSISTDSFFKHELLKIEKMRLVINFTFDKISIL